VIAGGTTEFGNKTFSLKQFHFHHPSEHRINEEDFPLEMHMVHEAAGKCFQSNLRIIMGSTFHELAQGTAD
jgi:carbonic anhydrase